MTTRAASLQQARANLARMAAAPPTVGADAVRATHTEHDRLLEDGARSARVRSLVAASWERSIAAGVPVDSAAAPLLIDRPDLVEYRDAHPLSRVFPLLYDVLGRAAEECDSLMAVGDAGGQLLWVCGRPSVLARAERINFVEGAAWDEAHAGTNAPGTALHLDAAVQIHASEHFARSVQPWSCAAAPIHDPVSQAVLGIVDITGGELVASPQTLAMVRAAARMAEAELGRLIAITPPDQLWLPPRPAATIEGLGRPDCQITVEGRAIRLTPRHSEIMVLLAEHPDGLSGDELAIELYAEDVRNSTTRSELARLRTMLGEHVLESRPYRLRPGVECDWLVTDRLIAQGRVGDALRSYRGPLLPSSDSPGVVARRERLEGQLRTAILASGDIDLMVAWTRSRWGADDLAMWQAQVGLLPSTSPLRAIAMSEADRLDREYGV